MRRLPALEDAPVMRVWAGLYEMTPDQMGILSALPGVDGLFVIAGFSGHGFMHGPIAGQLMAELVADGRAHTVDIAPLDIDRFRARREPGRGDDIRLTWASSALERGALALRDRGVEREEDARDHAVLPGQHHQLHEPGDPQLALHFGLEPGRDRFVGEHVLDHAGDPRVAGGQRAEVSPRAHPLDTSSASPSFRATFAWAIHS